MSEQLGMELALTPLQPKHLEAFDRAERLLFHFDFCPYFELKKLLADSSEMGRKRFKALFCRYYTLNTGGLTDAFRDRYFAILFDGGVFADGRPDYATILHELSAIKRRKGDLAMPFSFVSKLVAMLDDRQPIYDRHVCSFFGVKAPPTSMDKVKRIEWFVAFLNGVRESYQTWGVDSRMADVLSRLRNRDQQLRECSIVRQIDFLVWKAGNERLLTS
jgi:hypothetical protein